MDDICNRCHSRRMALVRAKCSDLCQVFVGDAKRDGYAPYDMNIGGGDDVSFEYCLDCGQMRGEWPLPVTTVERR